MDLINKPTLAIIGGTGKEGLGLAYRWAKCGYPIIIGSRSLDKAYAAVEELKKIAGEEINVTGDTNPQAAQKGDILVLTVPFSAHAATCESLIEQAQGKIVIDVAVPLVPPKVAKVQMPPEGSAAQQAQLILGQGVQVVAAFQNISYENLLTDEVVDCDVLVCGSGKEARELVVSMISEMGLTAWNAGPIENAVVVEGLTSVLIGLNKQFGVKSSGIRITGIERH